MTFQSIFPITMRLNFKKYIRIFKKPSSNMSIVSHHCIYNKIPVLFQNLQSALSSFSNSFLMNFQDLLIYYKVSFSKMQVLSDLSTWRFHTLECSFPSFFICWSSITSSHFGLNITSLVRFSSNHESTTLIELVYYLFSSCDPIFLGPCSLYMVCSLQTIVVCN